MKPFCWCTLVVILFIALGGAQPLFGDGEWNTQVTLEDLLSVEYLGVPVLSPDGQQFAFIRNGQIALMSSGGGWPATLTTTSGGKSDITWSPDSQWLAFASQGSIWVVPTAGGQPKRLTQAPPVSPYSWSPDHIPQWSPNGKWILFETDRRGNTDLMVMSREGKTTIYLTVTKANEGYATWSPDGTQISYTERSPQNATSVLKVLSFNEETGAASVKPRVLFAAPPERGGGGSIGKAVWSPDGQQLALALEHTDWSNIYLLPALGGELKQVTFGDHEDTGPAFSPDGKSLSYMSNHKNFEQRHVWIVSLEDGKARRLTPADPGQPSVEGRPQWSPDGSRIYFIRSTPLEPSNLLVAETETQDGGTPQYLTRILPRNFQSAGFSMPEVVHYPSKDGLTIAALLYKPRDFQPGAHTPGVLWLHGGPDSQDLLNWDPWVLYLTQQGYLVLQPNYRGSRGYGEKFRNLNIGDSGGGDLEDVVAGAHYLVTQGLVDPAHLGIGGVSHGGTLAAQAVTKTPALFKVAVELYGVTNRASYLERTNRDSAMRWIKKMGGTPEERPEVYRKANILHDVAKIQTPILIMHGKDDFIVPPFESEQFAAALKKHNKTHVYVTYPDEKHGFYQRSHRLDAWTKQLAFLRKYLNPDYGQSITSIDEFASAQ